MRHQTNTHRVGSRANITAPTPGLRKTRGLAGASGAAERAGRAHARAHAVRSLDDGMVWWLWGEAELGVG